jgi:glycine/D-amino acid oxidase-like deaminating enzyme
MQTFDVVIAGGGMSGVLAAVHLIDPNKNMSIHVLEAEKVCGGRLRSSRQDHGRWGFGLNSLAPGLVEFMTASMKKIYPQWSMEDYLVEQQAKAGYCAGGKVSRFELSDLFRVSGVKAMGGRNAAKEWEDTEPLLFSNSEKDHFESISKVLNIKRSGASGTILSEIARASGVPDVWSAPLGLLRAKALGPCRVHGYFDDLLDDTVELLVKDQWISMARHCRLVDLKKEGDLWILQTEQGPLAARNVILAHNPWSATSTVPREIMPVAISNLALKAKPVSMVALSTKIAAGSMDLDLVMIASEEVRAMRHGDVLTFQATIDYEMSLDAPEVVKAVKRLKRAAKKLSQYFGGLELSGEFIGLIPEAWAQPTNASDHKFIEKMKFSHGPGLFFVGDAYGDSFDGDSNIISSIERLEEHLSPWHSKSPRVSPLPKESQVDSIS